MGNKGMGWGTDIDGKRICLTCKQSGRSKPPSYCTEIRHTEAWEKQLKWHRDAIKRALAGDKFWAKYGNQAGYQRMRRAFLKDRAFQILGNKCTCNRNDCWHSGICNIDDTRVLQIHHKLGNGKEHQGVVSVFHRKIIKDKEFASTLKLLCGNCHIVETRELGQYSKALKVIIS